MRKDILNPSDTSKEKIEQLCEFHESVTNKGGICYLTTHAVTRVYCIHKSDCDVYQHKRGKFSS